jgi:phosphatidylinositol-3-phosphatase
MPKSRRTSRVLAAASLAVATTTALTLPSASAATAASAAPCTGAPVKQVQHVVVVMLENKDESSVMGSAAAPYLNKLATLCGQATAYHGVAHPSLPNYLALTGGQTFGVTDDNPPASHKIAAQSIFGQVGSSWRSYQESMAKPCQKTQASSLYAPKHNPAAYFTKLTNCAANDVPMPASPSFAAAFTLVTPNLQHDMHDGTIQQGDSWMSTFVAKVLASPQYVAGTLALFVVWDENDGPNHKAGNLIPCIVVAPSVQPGTKVGTSYTHYSMLATWENLLGLPRLGSAASSGDMVAPFRL